MSDINRILALSGLSQNGIKQTDESKSQGDAWYKEQRAKEAYEKANPGKSWKDLPYGYKEDWRKKTESVESGKMVEAVGDSAEAFYQLQDEFCGGECPSNAHRALIDELVRYLSGDQIADFVADFRRHYDMNDMEENVEKVNEYKITTRDGMEFDQEAFNLAHATYILAQKLVAKTGQSKNRRYDTEAEFYAASDYYGYPDLEELGMPMYYDLAGSDKREFLKNYQEPPVVNPDAIEDEYVEEADIELSPGISIKTDKPGIYKGTKTTSGVVGGKSGEAMELANRVIDAIEEQDPSSSKEALALAKKFCDEMDCTGDAKKQVYKQLAKMGYSNTVADSYDPELSAMTNSRDKVERTYAEIIKGDAEQTEVGNYIGHGMTKDQILKLIDMLEPQGYDKDFLLKDLAPMMEEGVNEANCKRRRLSKEEKQEFRLREKKLHETSRVRSLKDELIKELGD